jgi:hypothetical protein
MLQLYLRNYVPVARPLAVQHPHRHRFYHTGSFTPLPSHTMDESTRKRGIHKTRISSATIVSTEGNVGATLLLIQRRGCHQTYNTTLAAAQRAPTANRRRHR